MLTESKFGEKNLGSESKAHTRRIWTPGKDYNLYARHIQRPYKHRPTDHSRRRISPSPPRNKISLYHKTFISLSKRSRVDGEYTLKGCRGSRNPDYSTAARIFQKIMRVMIPIVLMTVEKAVSAIVLEGVPKRKFSHDGCGVGSANRTNYES